jgi:hypothetical protein
MLSIESFGHLFEDGFGGCGAGGAVPTDYSALWQNTAQLLACVALRRKQRT